MRAMLFSSVALTFLVTGALRADDRAATSQLPSALQGLGLSSYQVTSVAQAHRVRGQGGCAVTLRCTPPPCPPTNCSPPPPPPPPNCPPPSNCPPPANCPPPSNCAPCATGTSQSTTFVVSGGTSSGQVILMEGVVGQFQHTNQSSSSSTVIQGQFGGLSGNLGSDSNGNLAFSMGGKALQETVTFTGGTFNQVFSQSYRR